VAKRTGSKQGGRRRAGLPAPKSVVGVMRFTSPAGRGYRILRTTEQDSYDPPPKRPRKKSKT
jgi:hypothetical protein